MIVKFTGMDFENELVKRLVSRKNTLTNEIIPYEWERTLVEGIKNTYYVNKTDVENFLYKHFKKDNVKCYIWYNPDSSGNSVVVAFKNTQDMMMFKLKNLADDIRELWSKKT